MTVTTQDTPQTLAENQAIAVGQKTLVQKYFSVSLYRNALFLILNAMLPAAMGFLFWIIAARMYSPENIGIASALISSMTLIAYFSTLGLEFGIIKFLPQTKDKSGAMVTASVGITAVLAIIISTVFFAGIDIWAPSFHIIRSNILFLISFCAITLIYSVYYLVHHIYISKRQSGYTFAQTGVFSLIRFIPMILLASMAPSFGVFSGWGIGLAAGLLFSTIFLFGRSCIQFSKITPEGFKMVGGMFKYSFSNFALNLLWMAPGLVLPLMVTNQLGARANGYFYIGWAVAGVILMIPQGISLALFAEGSNESHKLKDNAHKSLLLMTCLILPAIALAFFFGERVLAVFGHQYSVQATRLLWLLAISALPMSVNYTYFSIGRVQQRMREILILSGFITATALVLSYISIPRAGIIGAGFSYLIAQTIPAFFTGYKLVKHQRNQSIPAPTN